MPWNATAPLGSVSVKANRPIIQQNITYIETTMGNSIVGTNTNTTRDHFWNVGANEDGRHRFINSPAFTVGGVATDPVLGAGMDGVLYLKTTNARAEWFHKNAASIYQVSPSFLIGTVAINSTGSYTNIVAVPAFVYGEIFMDISGTTGQYTAQTGFFKSNGATCEAWALTFKAQGSGTAVNALKFGNGSEASGLNIRARREDAAAANWGYRITYRSLL